MRTMKMVCAIAHQFELAMMMRYSTLLRDFSSKRKSSLPRAVQCRRGKQDTLPSAYVTNQGKHLDGDERWPMHTVVCVACRQYCSTRQRQTSPQHTTVSAAIGRDKLRIREKLRSTLSLGAWSFHHKAVS